VAAKDFFVDILSTALGPGEVLAAVHIRRSTGAMRFAYRKIRHPASGYAAAVRLSRRHISDRQTVVTREYRDGGETAKRGSGVPV